MKSHTILMLVLVAIAPLGCIGGKSSAETSATSAETQQQLLDRWNSTVANNPSIFTTSSPMGWDFYWPSFYEFPHPTYKGGSEDAYREFSKLLLIFLQTGDNFDFLANNGLFDLRLGYAMADGKVGQDWSLRELVNAFAGDTANTAYSNTDSATRDGLKTFATRIAALG